MFLLPWRRRWPGGPRSSLMSRFAASSPVRPSACPRGMLCRSSGHCWRGAKTRATSTCRSCSGGRSKRRSRPTQRPCWRCFEDRAIWDLPIVRATDRRAADAAVRRGGEQAGPDQLRAAFGDGAGAGSHQAADGGVRGGRRGPVADGASRRAGRSPGQVQRSVGDTRPASGQARGDFGSAARAVRRFGPTAPNSFSFFKSWARCAGRRASRLCCGSPASRPTTRCDRPP